MKIRIRIPNLRCVHPTRGEPGADEVYFTVYAAPGRLEGGRLVPTGDGLWGRVWKVKEGVGPGSSWTPEPSEVEVDLGEGRALGVQVTLYERDDGALHEELARTLRGPLSQEGIDWDELAVTPETARDLGETGALGSLLPRALFAVYKRSRHDDLVGSDSFVSALEEDLFHAPRELELRGRGALYRMVLALERVEA